MKKFLPIPIIIFLGLVAFGVFNNDKTEDPEQTNENGEQSIINDGGGDDYIDTFSI